LWREREEEWWMRFMYGLELGAWSLEVRARDPVTSEASESANET
jgi:hypothetical protein